MPKQLENEYKKIHIFFDKSRDISPFIYKKKN